MNNSKRFMSALFLALFVSFLNLNRAFSEEQQLRVGVITTLTGGMATIGVAVRNGVELARKDHPDLFKKVGFSYEDDQFDPKQSIASYRRLKNQDKADVILGFGTLLAQAIGPIVEKDQVPLINFNFEAAPVIGKRFTVRSVNHTDQYMGTLASYLRLKSGASTTFPIVQTEATFFNAMIGSLKKTLGEKCTLQEVAKVNPTENDFRTIIAKLKQYGPSQVGIFLWPEQLLSFLKQARELGFSAEYFGTDLCESAATLTSNEKLVEGCAYPDNDASEDFRSKYLKEYGNESQLTFAASAYDMTMLVGELVSKDNNLNAQSLLSKMRLVKDREGVLGKFSFEDSAQYGQFFEYPVVVKRIENGRGVAVKTE